MKRSVLRCCLAVATVVALTATQYAVAAFACPKAMAPDPVALHAADAPPCHEQSAPPATLPLCKKMCQGEPQKHEAPSAAALPPAADTGLKAVRPAENPALAALHADAGLAHPTGPPPTVLFARYLK